MQVREQRLELIALKPPRAIEIEEAEPLGDLELLLTRMRLLREREPRAMCLVLNTCLLYTSPSPRDS